MVVHPDELTGKDCLVAYVSPPTVDMQALDLTFRRKYPLYMVPALFQGVDSIPRLRSGQARQLKSPPEDCGLHQDSALNMCLHGQHGLCSLCHCFSSGHERAQLVGVWYSSINTSVN